MCIPYTLFSPLNAELIGSSRPIHFIVLLSMCYQTYALICLLFDSSMVMLPRHIDTFCIIIIIILLYRAVHFATFFLCLHILFYLITNMTNADAGGHWMYESDVNLLWSAYLTPPEHLWEILVFAPSSEYQKMRENLLDDELTSGGNLRCFTEKYLWWHFGSYPSDFYFPIHSCTPTCG